MALFNYATKEITLKIVYYGPGLSGKTTNIQYLHSTLNPENRGKLLSLSTESDRTLFFDFLPIELGKIKDFSIRFQLYTVPGQVRYNATRKVVLKGADAVVFVADSQRDMREQNIESHENMRENLISNNIDPDGIPIVFQYNKRDLKNILTIDELNDDINKDNAYSVVQAEAIYGKGVEDAFQLVTRLVLKDIARKHKIEIQPAPMKAQVNQEEIVAEALELHTESLQPDSEAAVLDAADFENAESLEEIVEPEYALEEELKETFAEKRDAPQVEAPSSTAYPIGSNMRAEAPQKIAGDEESSALSVEEMKTIASDVAKLQSALVELIGTVTSFEADMLEIKDSLSALKDHAASANEDRHLKELRKEQREIRSILNDIMAAVSERKTKKGWFRFS
jgi:small GTP-binding protein